MKNLGRVTTLILAISFIATGCNLLNKEEKTSTETQIVNADTVLDQQIYSRAIVAKDAKVCETIKDSEMKTECGDVVNAVVLTDQAVAKIDDGLCGGIKLDRYEENCKDSVKSVIDAKNLAQEQKQKLENNEKNRQEIEQKAVDYGDYTICDSMQDGNQKYSCRYNVLTKESIVNKDPTICEKIGEKTFIQNCKDFFESTKQ